MLRTPVVNVAAPINWAHPLMAGLVSRWKVLPFGQWAGGTQFKDLCRANDGTSTNATFGSALGRPGGNGSLTFASGNVTIPSTAIGSLSNKIVTACCWFRPTTSLTAYQAVFDGGAGSTTRQLSAFLGGAANHLYIALAVSAGTEVTISESWVLNTWQHLAITSDGTTATIYRNGQLVGATVGGIGAGFSTAAWQLGANPTTGGAAFAGQQDDAMLFRVCKSASEVFALYSATLAQYDPTLNWVRSWSRKAAGAASPATAGYVIGGGCGYVTIGD